MDTKCTYTAREAAHPPSFWSQEEGATLWHGEEFSRHCQRPLAFAHTIAPDMAGAMSGRGPRDADHIAAELHELLLQTGISGPVALMGQSNGGVYLRDYATRYPAEVAGLIFVDSATPLQNRNPALKPGGPEPRHGS